MSSNDPLADLDIDASGAWKNDGMNRLTLWTV